MKPLPFVIISLLVIFNGCIKVDETLTIEKNGSGNLELLYTIPEQTVTQMKSMFKLKDQMDAILGQTGPQTIEDSFERIFFDPSEDQIKIILKKYEQFGITIDKLKVETRNAVRNVTLNVKFADLARISKADFFYEHGFTLLRNQADNYTFVRVPENQENGFEIQNVGPETAGMLSPILNGFRVSLKVSTPGKILETNASRKTVYNAAWIFDYDKNPDAVKILQNQTMKIVFDGKGMQLPEVRQLSKPAQVNKR
ncbi:MAG: hypothetical protein PHR77_14465 [Kiritimatiellae bacterium]|nr:hypothetical protein [Kiritimatiellia bacterium]MDD5523333.1 hypothetical protein [Kiritimatiellia bacterium]